MKPFTRADRVGGLMQRTLSDILQKKIKDPRIGDAIITGVSMSSDIRFARIFFVVPGGGNRRDEAAEGFATARGYLKRELASRLGLRYMPDLKFCYDESFDYGSRIDDLLKRVGTDDDPDRFSTEEE
jgi:ribosome-binding factor A